MQLKNIEWRNVFSYGNKIQRIDFSDEGALWLIRGTNGSGKCLKKNTKITVCIDNKLIKDKFLKFLKNNH
jgi:hypothetical protein